MKARLGGASVVCAFAVLLLAPPRANAAPQTDAMLSEIAAALSNSEPRKAEQLATTALADDTLTNVQRARLLLDRGLAHEQLAEHNDALVDLTRAIEVRALSQPDQALALFSRGMALDALGRLKDALGDYDASIRLSPKSAAALNNRANAYRRLGRFEEAKRDYLASLTGRERAEGISLLRAGPDRRSAGRYRIGAWLLRHGGGQQSGLPAGGRPAECRGWAARGRAGR